MFSLDASGFRDKHYALSLYFKRVVSILVVHIVEE